MGLFPIGIGILISVVTVIIIGYILWSSSEDKVNCPEGAIVGTTDVENRKTSSSKCICNENYIWDSKQNKCIAITETPTQGPEDPVQVDPVQVDPVQVDPVQVDPVQNTACPNNSSTTGTGPSIPSNPLCKCLNDGYIIKDGVCHDNSYYRDDFHVKIYANSTIYQFDIEDLRNNGNVDAVLDINKITPVASRSSIQPSLPWSGNVTAIVIPEYIQLFAYDSDYVESKGPDQNRWHLVIPHSLFLSSAVKSKIQSMKVFCKQRSGNVIVGKFLGQFVTNGVIIYDKYNFGLDYNQKFDIATKQLVIYKADNTNQPNLQNLGSDNIRSIYVGKNVMALLYTETNYGGTMLTITHSMGRIDEQLPSANTWRSIKVVSR